MREHKFSEGLWDFSFILMMLVTITATGGLFFRTAVQMLFLGITLINFEINRKETALLLAEKLLFVCWGALSCLWAQFPESSIGHMVTLMQCIPLSMAVLIYVSGGKKKRADLAIWLVIASTLWMVVLVLRNYSFATLLSGNLKLLDRLSVNGLNPNYLGMCAGYSVLLVVGFRKRLRLPFVVTLLLLGIFGFLALMTGSRKALMTIVIGIVLLGIFSADNFSRALINLIIALIAVAGILYLMMKVDFIYETIGYRVEELLSFFRGEFAGGKIKDYSAFSRSVMMKQAWEIFTEHPVLGIGLYNYKMVGYYGRVSHCNYTELLSCLGIIGCMLYYGVQIVLMFRMGIRAVKGEKASAVIFSLLVCKMVNEFAAVSYADEMQQIIYMSFIGIFINNLRQEEIAEIQQEETA